MRRYRKETRIEVEGQNRSLFQEKMAAWVGEMAEELTGMGRLERGLQIKSTGRGDRLDVGLRK